MNLVIKKMLFPIVAIRRFHDNYLRKHNPEKLFSIFHKRSTGYRLNIDNPKMLHEKIAYLSFRTDTTVWTRLADKVRVREYVEECGYGEYLPKLYGIWEHTDDIDFEKLPKSFVLKTNNASATNILVRDKSQLDLVAVRNQLDEWMKIDYGYLTCQPHYSRIKPLILSEEFLGGGGKMLIDYKLYCINGNVEFVQVMSDRKENSHDCNVNMMDLNWKSHPEFCSTIHQQSGELKLCGRVACEPFKT